MPDLKVRDHVGDAWYQTVVRVPARWAGERIVLRFDAATHRGVVWVNDVRVAEHEGGYTPFEADITDVVEPGAEARVTIVVNNELTWESIPPGIVEDTPIGTRVQNYFHDFFNYAGLHRSVWLYIDSEDTRVRSGGGHRARRGCGDGAVRGRAGRRGFGRRGSAGRRRRRGRCG
ncbi:sugar-binding domain-containing protein [Yinghuangia aomiensis]